MTRSSKLPIVALLLAIVALHACSAAVSRGQSVEFRDYDVDQFDQAEVGDDGVERAAAKQRIVEETNRFRKEHDRSSVSTNEELAATAQQFAEYMARTDRYGHHADGRTPAERASAQDYEFCLVSENIGMRYDSRGYETDPLARGFVQGWIDSPEHRENMLDRDVTEIGVGLAMSKNSGRYYAVQMFGRPQSAAIEFSVTNRSQAEVQYQLGDRTFDLPPRMTRTHTRCRPAEMVVQLPDQDEQTVQVESGRRYVVRAGDGGELELAAQEG